MKTEKERLAELYGLTGMWIDDIPVNDKNYWCSRCKERLEKAEKVSFTIEELLWKPFRFEYHKECVIEALNEWRKHPELKKNLLKAGGINKHPFSVFYSLILAFQNWLKKD